MNSKLSMTPERQITILREACADAEDALQTYMDKTGDVSGGSAMAACNIARRFTGEEALGFAFSMVNSGDPRAIGQLLAYDVIDMLNAYRQERLKSRHE